MAAKRRDALRKLKELRESGASGLDQYKAENDAVLYDEITEDEHAAIVRRKLRDGDEFVVDDDGRGYADVGQNEWENSDDYSESEPEEDDEDIQANKKRKREQNKKKPKVKPEESITSLFSKQAQKKNTTAAPSDAELLNSIMDDLDQEADAYPQKRIKPTRAAPENPFVERIDRMDPYMPKSSSSRSTREGETTAALSELTVALKNEAMDEDVTQPEVNNTANSWDDDDETQFVTADELADQDLMSMDHESIKEEEAEPVVQVKALRTSKVDRAATASFAPKFEKVQPRTQPSCGENGASSQGSGMDWKSVQNSLGVHSADNTSMMPATGLGAQIKLGDVLESDGSLRMFWFDALEKDGVIYLFGKALHKKDNKYISCCAIVKNIERNLFFLPRQRMLDDSGHETDVEVTMQDVWAEWGELRKKHRIGTFKTKPVSRKYAFEIPGIPADSEYLKVLYSFKDPVIPSDSKGKSFSHVFGTNTSALELFILKRRLMGPCWVSITNAQITNKNLSWCKLEVTVEDPKLLKPFADNDESAPKQPPPLVVMSLTLRTVMNHQKHGNEIVTASGLVYNNVGMDSSGSIDEPSRFTAIRQLNDIPLPAGFNDLLSREKTRIEVFKNERGLLGWLMGAYI
ncbi:DNA-directed DNA polymerase alpha catalytic subunit pol1 [Rhizophlyctis rosea]|nr:DNA-directed DNA polymerase alpha catalytic subunit pol1 [Rhizophlyctis rosea]